MSAHKFKIGEIVTLRPAISRNLPGGAYEVIRQLPETSTNTASNARTKRVSVWREKASWIKHDRRRLSVGEQSALVE